MFVEPTVTLLPRLHDLVAAEGAVALLEAVSLPVVDHRVQHSGDVVDGAGRELVVVVPVPRGCRREHDEVALRATCKYFGAKIMCSSFSSKKFINELFINFNSTINFIN